VRGNICREKERDVYTYAESEERETVLLINTRGARGWGIHSLAQKAFYNTLPLSRILCIRVQMSLTNVIYLVYDSVGMTNLTETLCLYFVYYEY